jgi:hypothetical protein
MVGFQAPRTKQSIIERRAIFFVQTKCKAHALCIQMNQKEKGFHGFGSMQLLRV